MFDPMSALFPAVEKELQREAIGNAALESQIFELLFGSGDLAKAPGKPRRLARPLIALTILIVLIAVPLLTAT